MKRIVAYFLLFALLAGTSLWALNNIEDNERNVNPHWGKYKSKDADDPLNSNAYIEVDVDYPEEENSLKHLGRYGINYIAKAGVSTWSWSNEGYYNLQAEAYQSRRYKSVNWRRFAYRSIKDTHFIRYTGIAIEALNNGSVGQIERRLRSCYAKASIVQYDRSPGSGSNNVAKESIAEATSH